VEAVRRLVAAIRSDLEHIKSAGREGEGDRSELLAVLSVAATS